MELAQKPAIDALAKSAECGLCRTVAAGLKPGSDVANLSVMGYDPAVCYSGRSPLEAASIGVDLKETDVALRCNLVTLSDEENYADKTMVDYCADDISTADNAPGLTAYLVKARCGVNCNAAFKILAAYDLLTILGDFSSERKNRCYGKCNHTVG